ncbi:hypothetical protein VTN00DRAFT_6055 [Thermoascus crustaceus]|uniref:uncharacterized protein n=1 Tax=Thermoascus crustaceus TaxID=5088 RepID=UPI00374326B4
MNMNLTLTRLHHHILALSSTATRTTRKQRTPPPPPPPPRRRPDPKPTTTTTITTTSSHNLNPDDLLAYRLTGISQTKLEHLQEEASSNPEQVDLRRFVGNVFVNRAATDWVQRDLMRRADDIEKRGQGQGQGQGQRMVIRVERRVEIS